jgi:alpha-1,3-glucosyltransferase
MISADGYSSAMTVIYQRATVVLSEIVLYWGLLRYLKTDTTSSSSSSSSLVVVAASIFLHPGLWIVDHIHFQYNGLLYGILVHSIVDAKQVNPQT